MSGMRLAAKSLISPRERAPSQHDECPFSLRRKLRPGNTLAVASREFRSTTPAAGHGDRSSAPLILRPGSKYAERWNSGDGEQAGYLLPGSPTCQDGNWKVERRGGCGPAEQVALAVLPAVLERLRPLLLGLDALGHTLQVEISNEVRHS